MSYATFAVVAIVVIFGALIWFIWWLARPAPCDRLKPPLTIPKPWPRYGKTDVDERLEMDKEIYGVAIWMMSDDGKKIRLDPTKVVIEHYQIYSKKGKPL